MVGAIFQVFAVSFHEVERGDESRGAVKEVVKLCLDGLPPCARVHPSGMP
ncbi:hypothetical protein [Mesorhizobium sp.]|nr:hypothetical protein [Mesorhizobium sp.]